jgi:CBS domain-containing protein
LRRPRRCGGRRDDDPGSAPMYRLRPAIVTPPWARRRIRPYPLRCVLNQFEERVWGAGVWGTGHRGLEPKSLKRGVGVIKATKLVRDVMGPEPLTVVDASMSIDEAGRVMRAWDVDEVLVTDDGRLCGVLTGREVVVRSIASGRHPASISAGECCHGDLHAVSVDEPIDTAAELMRRHGLRRLPVTDADRLVGSVWLTTVARGEL